MARGSVGLAVLLLFACGSSSGADIGAADDSTGTGGDSSGGDVTSTGEPIVCCGCTCLDPAWSCSQETCIDGRGEVLELGPEAGYLELAPADGAIGDDDPWIPGGIVEYTRPATRVWYAFRPAQVDPESRPVLVFFNGGPGSATTSGLFAMNTGPRAIDTDKDPPEVVDNPYDWSSFANLLYLDMPKTGYSYPVDEPDPNRGFESYDNTEQEAADALRVIFLLLDRHPQLSGRVVLVGESYGGLRAAVMMRLLNAGEQLESELPVTGFRDRDLAETIAAHDTTRFGDAILIQPALPKEGDDPPLPGGCPGDIYACNHPVGDLEARFCANAESLVDPGVLSDLLGVDSRGIEWLTEKATGEGGLDFSSVFVKSGGVFHDLEHWHLEGFSMRVFAEVFSSGQWMLTDAGQDAVVVMSVLPELLEGEATVESASFVPAEGNTPRRLRVRFTAGETHEAWMPQYPDAGHAVPAYAPAALYEDVRAWLEDTE